MGDVLGSEAPQLPDDPFSLRARLEASPQETALNEMLITLGETRATGAVSAAYAEGVQVDVALALNRIDLDRFLATGETRVAPARRFARRRRRAARGCIGRRSGAAR